MYRLSPRLTPRVLLFASSLALGSLACESAPGEQAPTGAATPDAAEAPAEDKTSAEPTNDPAPSDDAESEVREEAAAADPMAGLNGTQVGDAAGVGGLGLKGTGRGGGGTGEGTIGLGNVGLIGKGGGGGTGSGYGRGAGALSKRSTPGIVRPMPSGPPPVTEDFDKVEVEGFKAVADEPLSTFSVDVDTASYAMVRRMLRDGQTPPADSVRLEELVNYFDYDYPEPMGSQPFSVMTEVASAPWAEEHRLLHVGLQGVPIDDAEVAPRNLVFLLDVSGSMNRPDALPLLKQGLGLLARQLRKQDKVSIVVYAGASGMVLPPTSGGDISKILGALESLQAGGSTNGGAGIELAYKVAKDNYIKGGINRVILATDGDFNVGTANRSELERLIEQKRETGVFLTVLGFGRGNTKDSTMQMLADKGNGNYAYIDSVAEARKVLVREAGATLTTIAKDVKIQVEFNPVLVESYRLIGYENRRLAAQDFNDDKKDAGEIGAGHTVTAVYEIVPAGKGGTQPGVDPLKYQGERTPTGDALTGEMATVKLRYKAPEGSTSKLISETVTDDGKTWAQASEDFRWSAAVLAFGMVLRGSEHRGKADMKMARKLAQGSVGKDPQGDRKGFLAMIDQASSRLAKNPAVAK